MNDELKFKILLVSLIALSILAGVFGTVYYYQSLYSTMEQNYMMMAEQKLDKARYDYLLTWTQERNKLPIIEFSEVDNG